MGWHHVLNRLVLQELVNYDGCFGEITFLKIRFFFQFTVWKRINKTNQKNNPLWKNDIFSSLKCSSSLLLIAYLIIDNDLCIQWLFLNDPLDSTQFNPQIIGIKNSVTKWQVHTLGQLFNSKIGRNVNNTQKKGFTLFFSYTQNKTYCCKKLV